MSAQSTALRQEPEKFAAQPVTLGPVVVPPLPSTTIAQATGAPRVPSLRVMSLQPVNPMRRFARVPRTAAASPSIANIPEPACLPLRLRGVAGRPEDFITLVTRDISSSGVFFSVPVNLLSIRKSNSRSFWSAAPWVAATWSSSAKLASPHRTCCHARWFGIAASFDNWNSIATTIFRPGNSAPSFRSWSWHSGISLYSSQKNPETSYLRQPCHIS